MSINRNRKIWTREYSSKAIFTAFILVLILNSLYLKYYTPIGLIILIIGVTAYFFLSMRLFIVKWMNLDYKIFLKKVFIRSIIIRLVFFLIMIIYTYIYDQGAMQMLELFPSDAWSYRAWGIVVSRNLLNGDLVFVLQSLFRNSADWGFAFYLGIVNKILPQSVIIVKLLNILWGSITVILISKTAYMLYSEKIAKVAGIVMMLIPSLIWFNVQYLKESLMILIVVIIFYNAVLVIKDKFTNIRIITIVSLTSSLFFFRTVLAVVVLISLTNYIFFNIIYNRRRKVFNTIILILFVGSVFYLGQRTNQLQEVQTGYSEMGGERGLESVILYKIGQIGGLSLKKQITIPFILISSFITPYPTFLNIDVRQTSVIVHSQNEITRIIMFYFAILAIPFLIKYDFKNSSLLLSFVIGYVAILALTGNSFEDRFQLPALPFIIIFIAVGLINSSNRAIKNWNYYLLFVILAVFLWHYFKLFIRGMA